MTNQAYGTYGFEQAEGAEHERRILDGPFLSRITPLIALSPPQPGRTPEFNPIGRQRCNYFVAPASVPMTPSIPN